jgi:hypothetical protein
MEIEYYKFFPTFSVTNKNNLQKNIFNEPPDLKKNHHGVVNLHRYFHSAS